MIHRKRRNVLLFGLIAFLFLSAGGPAQAQKNSPPGRRDPKLFRLDAGGAYAASAVTDGASITSQMVGFTQLTGNFTMELQYVMSTSGEATGTFGIVATNGDRITGSFTGTVSPIAYGYITVSGEWAALSGTGKYLGISGVGSLTGVMKPLAPTIDGTSGIVQITMTGELNLVTT